MERISVWPQGWVEPLTAVVDGERVVRIQMNDPDQDVLVELNFNLHSFAEVCKQFNSILNKLNQRAAPN